MKLKIETKKIMYLLGLLLSLSTSIIFLYLFFSAYFFGNNQVLMTINDYHEANIELVLAFATIIFGSYFYLISFYENLTKRI